jgi:hypothetical protein
MFPNLPAIAPLRAILIQEHSTDQPIIVIVRTEYAIRVFPDELQTLITQLSQIWTDLTPSQINYRIHTNTHRTTDESPIPNRPTS